MSELSRAFGDRLAEAVQQKHSAVCVGLDPRWKQLPDEIRAGISEKDLPRMAEATKRYSFAVIDAVCDIAPVLKPQSAFFEQLGPNGVAALSEVIHHARDRGMLVLLDGKRGDIGSTAEGYAQAYLGAQSPFACDALTVNPYLGEDTLEPFIQIANSTNSGVIVLVKTSNPGSGFVQDLVVDGKTIYQRIAATVQAAAAESAGESGYGSVGAVVGATYPEQLAALRTAMPNAWLLIPGYGAQGGTASDVALGFDNNGLGAIVNSSRGIIFAYESPQYAGRSWQAAIAEAAKSMTNDLQAAIDARPK